MVQEIFIKSSIYNIYQDIKARPRSSSTRQLSKLFTRSTTQKIADAATKLPLKLPLSYHRPSTFLLIVTESAKAGLICTKYTYSFYHIYLFVCMGYTISVSFIEFLRKFCVYDEMFDKLLC